MDELAPIIAAAASSSPGFTEHASELSQQDLEHWAERWARCSLRKNCAPRSPEVSSDKHHNRRLFLQSRAVLTKLWRSMGSAAASFSQRFVADQTGLNRKTLRLHWDYWLQLVAGPHPSLTGGTASAVPSGEIFDLAVSVPPAAFAEATNYGRHG